MENIISYFGTYTPAADGAIAGFKFEYLCTLGFAAIVIFVGRAIVAHSAALRKYAIPAPVVSGIIFSIIISIIKATGIANITFDATLMKDLTQNIFFLCVGFGFSAKMLKHAGGKLCVMIAVAACLLITCQNLLGVGLASLIGMNPLLALQCSSASMSGGVGTASAFGPIFEEWGAANATSVGVAAGTLGNVMGSLIGGPVAAFLIMRHGLKSDPNDKPEAQATGKVIELDNTRMIMMFALTLLIAALGMPIYCLLDNIPMIEMPKFIGCLFAGAIARNVMEAANVDGASYWQALFRIRLPLLMPSITICLFLTLSNCFKIYDVNLALTGGGPANATEMVSMNIFNEIFAKSNYGYGQAKAIVFFIIVGIITMFQVRLTSRREVEV